MTTSAPAGISSLPTPPPSPPRRGWWSRNWKWAAPVGCLLPVLICGGFVTVIVTFVFGMIKSSEPYQHALTQARANQAVVAALGTPIEPKFLVAGSINLNDSSGDANLTIPVTGAKGSGTIYVIGTRSDGVWSYSRLLFIDDSSKQETDLSKSQ